MNITTQGFTFSVLGRHPDILKERLKAAGAKTLGKLGHTTQIVVDSGGYDAQKETAKTRGLPIITEDQLNKLLAQGSLELDFDPPQAPAGERQLDALLGEARSLLAQQPSGLLWEAMVKLLEECALEQMSALVSYFQSHIERWSVDAQMYCVAPEQWLHSMYLGQVSEAYHLVRWLDLSNARVSVTALKKLFKCAQLTHVRRIDLSLHKAMSKAAYTLIAKTERYKTVEVFGFGIHLGANTLGLTAGTALAGVHTLGYGLGVCDRRELPDLFTLLSGDTFPNVTTLECRGSVLFELCQNEGSAQLVQNIQRLEMPLMDIDMQFKSPNGAELRGFTFLAKHMTSLQELLFFSRHNLFHRDLSRWDLSPLRGLKTLHIYKHKSPPQSTKSLKPINLSGMIPNPGLERIITDIELNAPSLQMLQMFSPHIKIVKGVYAQRLST